MTTPSNHPAPGKAGIAPRLTNEHTRPGLPDPGRWGTTMQNIVRLLSVTALCHCAVHARALSLEGPRTHVTASYNGRHFFLMHAPTFDEDGDTVREGQGTMYEVLPSGEFEKRWSLEGWYAWTVFVSDDGDYLVRVETLPRGQEASPKDLAVAFYRRGTLIKSYATSDLLDDRSAVLRYSNFYTWLTEDLKWNRHFVGHHLWLTTTERIEYDFDIRSGEIIRKEEVPQPDGAANRSQPVRGETNRTSVAAGSDR